MLTITEFPNGLLGIKADYFYSNRIRQIPTAHFDYDSKQWTIQKFMLGVLEQNFKGEIAYKTPRWVILKQPMPDMSKMYEIQNKSIQVPDLKVKLYDYQDYTVRFMIDRIILKNVILNALEVGLGKSPCTIATMKWFIENRGIKKFLIICKKSIKKQWQEEIKKFCNIDKEYKIFRTETTPKKRKEVYDGYGNSDKAILITNYHTFLNDTELIKNLNPEFIVCDEIHLLRNRTGKMNNNIKSVASGKPTIFLTGTPIMNRPEDMFGIMQIANPDYFGKWSDFSKNYLTWDYNGRFGTRIVGAKNLDELRQKTQDILIRLTEHEVSIQLPKTIIKRIDCDMDKTQYEILKKIQDKQELIMTQKESIQSSKMNDDVKKTQLEKLEASSKALIAARQAASSDPRLFLRSNSAAMKEEYGKFIPKTYKMSDKTESIIELVQEIIDADEKVILFTKFRTNAVMIAEDLNKSLKVPALLYTGAENEKQRDEALDLFKNTDTHNILIGTEALAEGVNLREARHVINIDQPDTFAIKVQRIGRARRANSTYSNIIAYDMITESIEGIKSKDEERLENIQKNSDLTDSIVSIDEAQRDSLIKAMKAG